MSEFPKTVKEFSPDERPQEKAERLGVNSLSLSELWAVILRAGQPGVPITELTRRMMHENDNKLKILERRSRDELMQIPGIGPVKAIQIEAVLEIMRRYNMEKLGDRVCITGAEVIADYMRPLCSKLNVEKIWILFLSRKNDVILHREMSSGGSTATVFDVKKIIRDALLVSGCEAIVMCHNHPSGNNRPSGQDDAITRQLADACKMLSIRFLDHVIIAGDTYYSYYENGRL